MSIIQPSRLHYVCGFAFTPDFERVALIRKNKPEWQKGLLNGVGGKVEDGETPALAMEREFTEETGVQFNRAWWKPTLCMRLLDLEEPTTVIDFFAIVSPQVLDVRTTTSEEVGLFHWKDQDKLLALDVVPNLPWLIPMARACLRPGWPPEPPDFNIHP